MDLKSTGEEAFAFSPVFLRLFSAYMTCAMKLPIVCAASLFGSGKNSHYGPGKISQM